MHYPRSRPLSALPECVKPSNSLVTCDLTVLVLSAWPSHSCARLLSCCLGTAKCTLRKLEHSKVCMLYAILMHFQVTRFEQSDWLEVMWLALRILNVLINTPSACQVLYKMGYAVVTCPNCWQIFKDTISICTFWKAFIEGQTILWTSAGQVKFLLGFHKKFNNCQTVAMQLNVKTHPSLIGIIL